jgi:hypothetical protein
MTGPVSDWPSMQDTWDGLDGPVPTDEHEFRMYLVRRMDKIDADNRRILLILVVGKWGYRIIVGIGLFAAAVVGFLSTLKGLR